MKISLKLNSPEAQAQIHAYAEKILANTIKASARGLKDVGATLQADVRGHVKSALGGKGTLAKSYRAKVYDKKADRFPQLRVYSKVPWAGTHEYGATINGKMLIPLDQKYGSAGARGQKFKQNIEQLRRGGNTVFVKTKKGQVILMAENIKEHEKPLSSFKRRYRKKHDIKRLRRGAMVPIAILVNKVTLKKRTNVERVVVSQMPKIVESVSARLKSELLS